MNRTHYNLTKLVILDGIFSPVSDKDATFAYFAQSEHPFRANVNTL